MSDIITGRASKVEGRISSPDTSRYTSLLATHPLSQNPFNIHTHTYTPQSDLLLIHVEEGNVTLYPVITLITHHQ